MFIILYKEGLRDADSFRILDTKDGYIDEVSRDDIVKVLEEDPHGICNARFVNGSLRFISIDEDLVIDSIGVSVVKGDDGEYIITCNGKEHRLNVSPKTLFVGLDINEGNEGEGNYSKFRMFYFIDLNTENGVKVTYAPD